MFNSLRQRAVNSEPTLIGYLSSGAKMEGERPGSLTAKYCSTVLRFISAGRSDQKLCGNVRSMCYFVKMSLSQVSCAVFARGLRALSMQLWRATGAQDHPKASSCFQWSGDSLQGKARVNFHRWPWCPCLLLSGPCEKDAA